MVKRRSLIVSLVMVLGVCPVCPDAAVYISSVLPTRGTLHYAGINAPEQRLHETGRRTQEGRGVVQQDVVKQEELHLTCQVDTCK